MHNVLIFGGTFDPIHQGHLKTVITIQEYFQFERVLFLPCKIPVLKDHAGATAQQRIDMLELALAPYKKCYHFEVNCSEIERDTPSYMVLTLEHFRQQWSDDYSITLLMGFDTFAQLPRWYEWQKLLTLCHLLVIERPGFNQNLLSPTLINLLNTHKATTINQLKQTPAGLIYSYDAGHYDLSSTAIREKIKTNKGLTDELCPEVYNYIQENNLYY